jgi:glucokinase
MKRDIAVTVDLGGTNLRLGAVSRGGDVLLRDRAKMGSYRRSRDLLGELSSRITGFLPGAEACGRVRAVSLGFAGYTDSSRGLIYFAPNVGGLRNIEAGPYLEKHLGLPVYVENDANCAALGEYALGAGRGAESLFMFTLGTGVGGGFIAGGEIWRGALGTAGEIGHTIVMAGGPRCSCGNRGCLEAFASATAIVREYRRLKGGGRRGGAGAGRGAGGIGTRGGRGAQARTGTGKVTARQVADLARRGDRAAIGAIAYAAGGLGTGIANVFNLLNPELILIGGGVSRAGSILLRSAVTEARSIVCSQLAPRLKVRRAALGDDAALLGAARLAFTELRAGPR